MHGLSPHCLRTFEFVRRHPWVRAETISRHTGDARRTVREHCTQLYRGRVFERVHFFDGCRYRVAEHYSSTELGQALEHARCVVDAD